MTTGEIKEIVNSEIKNYMNDSLDNEIKKLLHNSGSKSRDELISIIRNSLDALYKALWQKKDFWMSNIK